MPKVVPFPFLTAGSVPSSIDHASCIWVGRRRQLLCLLEDESPKIECFKNPHASRLLSLFYSAFVPKAGGTFARGDSQVIHNKRSPFMGFSSPVKDYSVKLSLWITLSLTYDWKDGMALAAFSTAILGRGKRDPGRAFFSPFLSPEMEKGRVFIRTVASVRNGLAGLPPVGERNGKKACPDAPPPCPISIGRKTEWPMIGKTEWLAAFSTAILGKNGKRPRLYPGRALRSESLTGLPPCGAACSTPPKRPY